MNTRKYEVLGHAHSPEPSPFRLTVRWKQLIAQAEALHIRYDCGFLVIAAAGPDSRRPTDHDILNAQLCGLVFSRQERFRSIGKFAVFVKCTNDRSFPVRLNNNALEESLDRYRARDANQTVSLLPAPLFGYLLRLENRHERAQDH